MNTKEIGYSGIHSDRKMRCDVLGCNELGWPMPLIMIPSFGRLYMVPSQSRFREEETRG